MSFDPNKASLQALFYMHTYISLITQRHNNELARDFRAANRRATSRHTEMRRSLGLPLFHPSYHKD